MRKTKIVCTLGPSTDDEAVLRELILSGMNVARLNMSHGTHEEHKRRADARVDSDIRHAGEHRQNILNIMQIGQRLFGQLLAVAKAHAQPPRQVAFHTRLEAVTQKRFSHDIHRRSPPKRRAAHHKSVIAPGTARPASRHSLIASTDSAVPASILPSIRTGW